MKSTPRVRAFVAFVLLLIVPISFLSPLAHGQSNNSPLDKAPSTLTTISPTEAYNWQPTMVTITGTGFYTATGTSLITPSVYLDTIPLTDVTFVSSTTLTATVLADLPGGSYTLTVMNPDGQSVGLVDAFTILHSGDGLLGPWQDVNSLIMPRSDFAAVAVGGYLYVLGGEDGNQYLLNSVERAAINADGSLGPWQAATTLTTAREEHAAVAAGDYLYVLGGIGPENNSLSSVERAAINADGSLGPWQTVNSMTTARIALVAVTVGERLYALGDDSSNSSVEWAKINADGSLGPWQTTRPFATMRTRFGAASSGSYLYVLGGDDLSSVERAAINADGSLGPWQTVNSMTTGRRRLAATATRGYLYAIGGIGPGNNYLSMVERAAINANGSLGPWQTVNSMTVSRFALQAVAVGNDIYALGGEEEYGPTLSRVERVAVSPPVLTNLSPSVAPANHATTITIAGTNFLPTPDAWFGEDTLQIVSFVSTRTLTATVPAGLTSGWYTATLTNPDGQVVSLTNALRVDDTIPTAENLTINGGALSSTSISTILTVSASDPTDGVAEMSFSNDGSTWSDWRPYSNSATWSLSVNDGEKTVHGQFRDTAGNVSSVISDTIELDTTTATEYGLTINDGALFTNKTAVTLSIGARPGTAQMQVSNDGGFAGTEWEPYASHKEWEITQYGSYVIPRVVYVRYGDINGNASATYQDDIILDVNAPTGSVQAIPGALITSQRLTGIKSTEMRPVPLSTTINYSHTIHLPVVQNNFCIPFIGPPNFTLNLQAEDDVSGVADMIISHLPNFTCSRWEPYTTVKAWYAPDGATMVYVRFRDNAGNESSVYTDNITP